MTDRDVGPPLASDAAWPLLGRDAELNAIAAHLGDASLRGVVITAQAGVGKSRLARRAVAAAADRGAVTEWVQGTRSAATVPLGAFAALVPSEARAEDALELMRRSGEALRERAAGRRVVLGVDDAQLLDAMSATLVLHLASREDVFVVATVRSGEPCPDAIVSLWKDGLAPRVELAPLDDAHVATLVEQAVGAPLEEPALRWLQVTAQGNPLYVRELVTGAVEAGTLARSAGLWRLVGRPTPSSSLRESVGRRLGGLPDEQRAALELLALGEPLWLPEIAALAGEDVLVELESRGLIVTQPRAGTLEVRLSHPLFGDVLGEALGALHARRLRLRLAEQLELRSPVTADDALRIARLRLDAGSPIPPTLRLDAARAANLAGDPDLGATLSELALADGPDLPAAMTLARARSMRNRQEDAEQALAAVEALAPRHPDAAAYLTQRGSVLFWGLRRPSDALALMERAEAWSPDPEWAAAVQRAHQSWVAQAGGFSLPPGAAEAPTADDATDRTLRAVKTLSLLFSGRGDQAWAAVRRMRPSLPLRELPDTASLANTILIALETGYDWPEVEDYMTRTLREAVRLNDHEAAGFAAFMLGALLFLRGRFRDAARWMAEAELRFGHHDTFDAVVHVHTFQVGIAYHTGDYDDALRQLDRVHAALADREPLAVHQPYVLRAEGWAARVRGDAHGAKRLLAAADELGDSPIHAAQLTYEARRAGASVGPALAALADRCTAPLVAAYAAHAVARDGEALLAAADAFAAIGAQLYALEAAADAAAAFVNEGRAQSARRAAAHARALHVPGQGTEPPDVDGVAGTAVGLTAREAQLVELAGRGLSNAEIAERLVLSVRTVESHLYRAMQKLGISRRGDL
ncbi:hypothetical protein DVA67_027935 [Solirubrobacter sp. CPCC 204708]|uniref:LuxR C-terminal-related transcriptional regulator n=1 Tax=Solirubrobacter deserti TaxID=2282478 RepID=A0ABT4RJK3_9ACTN|nr:helix-turn-helix transcriptional regulator [Solirubrobacter deserti]MBE2319827.1 hypothetical protein [Solirubrobacter deserti]MDA0138692.1 LuxR C-terminal-related transcriptional regulator [Solirubrobacter deserti]